MIKKISYSALCFAIMGCSTSTNIVPTKEAKVDSVKVNQVNVFDLGKKGSSVKANFNLGKEKSPFGIKGETPADLVGNIDCVKVFLYGVANGTGPVDLWSRGSGLMRDIPVSSSAFGLTFSGLQPGFDYYVSAQAFSNSASCTDFTNAKNETSGDGTSANPVGNGMSGAVGIVYTPALDYSTEEYIAVSPGGIPDIINDQNDGFSTWGDHLDMYIQLRRSTNAAVGGSVGINNGAAAPSEDITSP